LILKSREPAQATFEGELASVVVADRPIHKSIELLGMHQDVHSTKREDQDQDSVAHIGNCLSRVRFAFRGLCRFHIKPSLSTAPTLGDSAGLPCALGHKSVALAGRHFGRGAPSLRQISRGGCFNHRMLATGVELCPPASDRGRPIKTAPDAAPLDRRSAGTAPALRRHNSQAAMARLRKTKPRAVICAPGVASPVASACRLLCPVDVGVSGDGDPPPDMAY
jgi:hypothetical protein